MLKEERFLLLVVTGLFVVFTLFTAQLFSMISFTRGFIQVVNDDSYYFIQQAFAQEEVTQGEEPTGEVDQPPSTEEPPLPPPCELTTAGCPEPPPTTDVVPERGEEEPPTTTGEQQPPTALTNETTPLPPGCVRTTAGTIYCPPSNPPPNNTVAIPQPQPYDLNAVYVISMRGNFDLKTGASIRSDYRSEQGDGYNGKYKLIDINELYKNCPAEVALLVHGFDNSPTGALEKFDRAKMSVEHNNYKIPIIGFSWDSNPQLDDTLDRWNVAKKIALANGPILAQFIIDFKNKCSTSIHIVGHSQGAQVIFAALLSIFSNTEWVLLGPYVKDIHLLGAAVNHHRVSTNHENCGSFAVDFNEYPPVNEYRCVGRAIEAVVGDRFVYNLYSSEDRILFWAYERYWGENHAALGKSGADPGVPLPKNYVQQDVTGELPSVGDADGNGKCDENLMCVWYLPDLETGENHFGYWGYRNAEDKGLLDDGAMNVVVSNWRGEFRPPSPPVGCPPGESCPPPDPIKEPEFLPE